MSEPSKEAIEAERKIHLYRFEDGSTSERWAMGSPTSTFVRIVIQSAIDQACAAKDSRISQLEERLATMEALLSASNKLDVSKDAAFDAYRNAHGENMAQLPKALCEIAALKADIELLKKNEVINDGEFTAQIKRIAALEALIADCPECSRVMKAYEPKP
jgi:hypothetical protein